MTKRLIANLLRLADRSGLGDHTHRVMFSNASSVCAAWAVTGGFGIIYWLVAARSFPLRAVGLASASIAAMLLVGNIVSLGFSSLVVGEVQRRRHAAGSLILVSLAATFGIGVLVGGAFGVIAGAVVSHRHALNAGWPDVLLFASGVGLTSASIVFDQALIGLLRGAAQLRRNTAFAVIKVVLLAVCAAVLPSRSSSMILATWVIGIAASLLFVGVPILAHLPSLSALRPSKAVLAGVGQLAGTHQVFNLALKLPLMSLPLLVPALLSPSINASFYVATTMAGLLYEVPGSLATVLYAAGSARSHDYRSQLRFSLRTSVVLTSLACIVTWPIAPFVLGIFGPAYVHHGAVVLRIFALAALPMIVKVHYSTVRRLSGDLAPATLAAVLVGALLEFALAIAGAKVDGVKGLSAGWGVALCFEATAMIRVVWLALTDSGRVATQTRVLKPRSES